MLSGLPGGAMSSRWLPGTTAKVPVSGDCSASGNITLIISICGAPRWLMF